MAVFHKVLRLDEDLRHCRYNVTEYIEVHLRKMRNKQLDLAGLGHTVSFTTMKIFMCPKVYRQRLTNWHRFKRKLV